MRDVGERATVDEGGIVFERLDQIGIERVLGWFFRSAREVARQKIAITSEATTISKLSARG